MDWSNLGTSIKSDAQGLVGNIAKAVLVFPDSVDAISLEGPDAVMAYGKKMGLGHVDTMTTYYEKKNAGLKTLSSKAAMNVSNLAPTMEQFSIMRALGVANEDSDKDEMVALFEDDNKGVTIYAVSGSEAAITEDTDEVFELLGNRKELREKKESLPVFQYGAFLHHHVLLQTTCPRFPQDSSMPVPMK